jgi:hypothetical protein
LLNIIGIGASQKRGMALPDNVFAAQLSHTFSGFYKKNEKILTFAAENKLD